MSFVPLFALGSAAFYSIAMIAMKSWWKAPGLTVALIIVATLIAGVLLEIIALRQERLGIIYVGILGAEVVLIGAASWLWFGESFSIREGAGIALVLVGTALAWA